jgi:hypothetical protein
MWRDEQRKGPDRRTEPRYRINEAALLRSTGDIAAVRVIDISAIGLRVTSPCPQPVNSAVEVQFGGAKITGFVKNSRCIRATEFHLGIVTAPLAGAEENAPARLDHLPILRRARQINRGIPIDRRNPLARTA